MLHLIQEDKAFINLPALDPYGKGYSAMLLHPQVSALLKEYPLDDNASSSSKCDDNAASSPFLPLMQTWNYRKCDQPSTGALHQTFIL